MRKLHAAFQFFNTRYALRGAVTSGKRLHVGPGSRIWAPTGLVLGDDVYVGKRCTIEVDGEIGSQVLIANNVGIVGRRDHAIHEVGTPIRSATWCGSRAGEHLRTRVHVGHDVWIGFGAIILAPVRVGRGSIVAAGAVVTHDVEPYSIVAGNPARSIGMRFNPADIQDHEVALDFKGE